MAEDTVVNGEGETFYDDTEEMNRKVEILEKEKHKLAVENDEANETVEKMKIEIEEMNKRESELKAKLIEMESDLAQSEEGSKATAAIAARAAGLETELSRLQHDLIQAMSEAEEANSEVYSLKKVLAERTAAFEALQSEVEGLKAAKSDSDEKAGILEASLVLAEEEARESIKAKESEIMILKKTAEALRGEVESLKEESSRALAAAEIKQKADNLASEMAGLEEVGTKLLGITDLMKEADEKNRPLNIRWPVVAGSVGAVVAGSALVCAIYHRRH